MLLAILSIASRGEARGVFLQPTNWLAIAPSSSPSQPKSQEINAAINYLRGNGGGTVFLAAGTYYLDQPIVIETQGTDGDAVGPYHVRVLGARRITSAKPAPGETLLLWRGQAGAAVFDVRHAMNPTLENLRIQADAGYRFKYGVFFHRVHSALTGTSQQPAPGSINILDSAVGPAGGVAGHFTVGVRINNASENELIDQNVDLNYIENLFVDGATDDSTSNACGVWLDGSQVQANYFRNVNVSNSGTGVLNRAGNLVLVGGAFANNRQATSINNPSGGGDFVFRSGNGGGHLIQGVTSTNSYRFFTSYYEGLDDLQTDSAVAVAIVGCTITSYDQANRAGDVVYARGAGGPLAIVGCDFGGTSGPPQLVRQGQWTQGSLVISASRFNHVSAPFYDSPFDAASTRGERPRVALVDSQGWDGGTRSYRAIPNSFTDPADARYTPAAVPTWFTPRTLAERPEPTSAYTINLGAPFTYNGVSYLARANYEDFDNGPVINAAIEKIKREAPGGSGTVWFPSGAYVVKTPVSITAARGVRLMGVGGRNWFVFNGAEPPKGSALIWNGSMAAGSTLLKIDSSQSIAVEGLLFTTYNGPGGTGATTIDRFVQISQSQSAVTQGIWFQDVGADWLSGDVERAGAGVCNSFARIGDGLSGRGAQGVTMLSVAVHHAAQQGILLDGGTVRDVQLLEYTAPNSRRGVRTTTVGGGFSWIGGGFGAIAGQYEDATAVDLGRTTETSHVAGLEVQDITPVRLLRTAQTSNPYSLSFYGNNGFVFAPGDQRLIDLRWGNGPVLHLYGNLLGISQGKVAAARGAAIRSLANFYRSAAGSLPWLATSPSVILDLGSRQADEGHISIWPFTVNNAGLYSSLVGAYSLSPLSVRAGSAFPVSWVAGPGDSLRQGDWAALYLDESSPSSDAPFSAVELRTTTGQYRTSGTSAELMKAPTQPGTYELRYMKNGGSTVVHRVPLDVLP